MFSDGDRHPLSEAAVLIGLGGLLSMFSYASAWTVPVAAWFVPIFYLRLVRTGTAWRLLFVWLSSWLAVALSHRGIINVPGPLYPLVVLASVTPWLLPYLAHRTLARRLGGFTATLVFPSAWVATEMAASSVNPFGTWGAVAYTQYGNLPLMQLTSVTGIWGITFLVMWFASVTEWAWSNQWRWPDVGRGVGTYASVWTVIMLLGGIRIALAGDAPTVRVAGIGLPEGILEIEERTQSYQTVLPEAERERMASVLAPLTDRLFADTRREARAGAMLVVWHETATVVFEEDEPAFLERGARLAADEGVYLLMTEATIHKGAAPYAQNKAILFTPTGATAFEYVKSRPLPGEESYLSRRGDGQLRFADTPFGRLAAAICSDLDYPFPPLAQQSGRGGADILLVPASDWEQIKYLHPQQAAFHAIANGLAIFRPNRFGLSMAFDRYGRVLASMDDFTTADRTLVANLPTTGGATIYARLGNWFGWLCGMGLLVAVWFGTRRQPHGEPGQEHVR